MKARVKTTGEIVEVVKDGPFYNVIDGYERYYEHELDFNDTVDYWTRREHQYAGMFMKSFLDNFDGTASMEQLSDDAIKLAHAIVEKLKEKEDKK